MNLKEIMCADEDLGHLRYSNRLYKRGYELRAFV
jgi:hypothetical protein